MPNLSDEKNESCQDSKTFEEEGEKKKVGILRELWEFYKWNKKWWLLPLFIILITMGLVIAFAGSPVAPLIYSIF